MMQVIVSIRPPLAQNNVFLHVLVQETQSSSYTYKTFYFIDRSVGENE